MGMHSPQEMHLFFVIGELRLSGEPFGVMAPKATEGTALQEYGGTDAVAVVDGEAFELDDRSVHRTPHRLHSAIILAESLQQNLAQKSMNKSKPHGESESETKNFG